MKIILPNKNTHTFECVFFDLSTKINPSCSELPERKSWMYQPTEFHIARYAGIVDDGGVLDTTQFKKTTQPFEVGRMVEVFSTLNRLIKQNGGNLMLVGFDLKSFILPILRTEFMRVNSKLPKEVWNSNLLPYLANHIDLSDFFGGWNIDNRDIFIPKLHTNIFGETKIDNPIQYTLDLGCRFFNTACYELFK